MGTTETSRERSTSGHTKMGNKQTIKKYKGSNAATVNNIEYGVARGVDFQRVHFVLNVDCPPTLSRCANAASPPGFYIYISAAADSGLLQS